MRLQLHRGERRTRRFLHGFTLIEVLVVAALLASLGALSLTMIKSASEKAKQVSCANNMRQLGSALQGHAQDHGRYPETTHSADEGKAWVAALEDYLGDYDEVRVCPADPQKLDRLRAGGTSYILNSFVFVPRLDPFGRPIGRALDRPQNLPRPSQTLLAFCCSDHVGVSPGNDHTHSERWSSWSAVTRDIAPDRHGGKRSNYLFADGRVEVWTKEEVQGRIESGDNIALPPGT